MLSSIACSPISTRSYFDASFDASVNSLLFFADEDLQSTLVLSDVLAAGEAEMARGSWAGRATSGKLKVYLDSRKSGNAAEDPPLILHFCRLLEMTAVEVERTFLGRGEREEKVTGTGGYYVGVLVDAHSGKEVWKCIIEADPKEGFDSQKEASDYVRALFKKLDEDRTSKAK
jgi:hypothetical protein